MSDTVKLIIEISKEDYERCTVMASAIRNGTPLPKGHGRLIDADALENHLKEDADEWDKYALARVKDAPTVIEADEGSEDV